MEKDEIERNLEELPYKAAKALKAWRDATRDREVLEAQKILAFKLGSTMGVSGKPMSDEVAKWKCRATPEWRAACDAEADCEAAFWLLNERHLSNKKMSGIRTAF